MKAGVPEQLTRGLKVPRVPRGHRDWFEPFFEVSAEEVDETVEWRRKVLAESQTFHAQTPSERALAFALRRVEFYKADYDRIKAVLKTRRKDLGEQRDLDRRRLKAVKLQLEEALRDAGELQEAEKYAISAERLRKLKEAQWAVIRPDSDDCGCPDEVVDDVELPHLQVLKRVFSKKHLRKALKNGNPEDAFPYLVKCVRCGFRNVTNRLPESLRDIRRVRGLASPQARLRDAALRVPDSRVKEAARRV